MSKVAATTNREYGDLRNRQTRRLDRLLHGVSREAAHQSPGRTDGARRESGAGSIRSPRCGVRRHRCRQRAVLRLGDLRGAEDVRIGAQLLHDVDAGRDAGGGDLERLGPKADDHAAEASRCDLCGRCLTECDACDPELDAPVRAERHRAEAHRGRADEACNEGVRGSVVQDTRSRALLQSAVPQHRDTMPQSHRLRLIVRHVHGRHAEACLQARHVGTHLHAQLGVQVRERLVHQVDTLGWRTMGTPDRHSLALAAGKLGGLSLQQVAEAQHLRHLLHTRIALSAGHPRHLERETDVRGDGQ